MYLDAFYQTQNDLICIQPEQASRFAKEVAQDFNPLHNPDSKRFCVPGDLLFALILAKTGLSANMTFHYTGMVGKEGLIKLPSQPDEFDQTLFVTDPNNKPYLNVSRHGDITQNMAVIEAVTRSYVAFSGHSFPHILVPLMAQHKVMINPERPMVIYESMAFEFDHLTLTSPILVFEQSELEVQGKRGTVTLKFKIVDQDKTVGKGHKTMVLSGLREFDKEKIKALVDAYEQTKIAYQK